MGHGGDITEGILQPVPIIFGASAGIFILGYVIELFRSGWLTLWRAFVLLLPFIGALSVYLGLLALRGEPVEQLSDGAAFSTLSNNQFSLNVKIISPTL